MTGFTSVRLLSLPTTSGHMSCRVSGRGPEVLGSVGDRDRPGPRTVYGLS